MSPPVDLRGRAVTWNEPWVWPEGQMPGQVTRSSASEVSIDDGTFLFAMLPLSVLSDFP